MLMTAKSRLLGDHESSADGTPEDGAGPPLDDHDSLGDADAAVDPDQQAPVPPNGAPALGLTGLERKAASEAYRKVLAGQSLTSREQTLLKRVEKEKEERLRWQYYASIPQKHWRAMSGRQSKVLQEQADRYGLPFGGPTINLPTLARAIHDFLADNAQKLAKEDDVLLQGAGSPALERYREERAAIARLDRLEREGQLLPREMTRVVLGRIATILRDAGDTLQRQFGPAAAEILHEALEDAEREIDRTFGAAPDDSQQPVEQPCDDPEPPEQPDDDAEPSHAG